MKQDNLNRSAAFMEQDDELSPRQLARCEAQTRSLQATKNAKNMNPELHKKTYF